MRADRVPPHVHILMCTLNGAAFLPAQLQSFLDQSHAHWSLWVQDDGSTDATLAVLDAFRAENPSRDIKILRRGAWLEGSAPKRGSAANFLSLLGHPDLPPGHVAFADQDDVWLGHKLERGLSELARLKRDTDKERAAVYASRSLHVRADLAPDRPSTLHRRPPAFGNALVQNVLGGNTILLDRGAAALMRATVPAALAAEVPFHDWWVYLVMTGAEALVLNDPEPGLLYRQHGSNVLGASQGVKSAIARLGMITNGVYSGWISRNLAALDAVGMYLTPAHRQLAADFAALRQSAGPLARRAGLRRLGIYRQSRAGNLLIDGLALAGQL